MGLVVRQSIFSTVISYAGVAIGYVNLLYLYPRFLEPEQIGLLRTVQDAAILFAPFAQMGVAQSIIRFYPQYSNNPAQTRSFLTLMLQLAAAGFALFAAAFLVFQSAWLGYFQENAGALQAYSMLILWLTLILLLQSVLEACSRSLLKTVLPNLLRDVVVRLAFGVLVICYFGGWLTFPEFMVSTLFANALAVLVLLISVARSGQLALGFRSQQALPAANRKQILHYALLTFAGTAGAMIVGKIDSLMVAGILGLAANGIYTTAFYMATVIEIPKRALLQIAMPLMARAFEKNDLHEVHTIYQKTALNQFIIGALVLVGVWANLDALFSLMPRGAAYAAGKYVVLFVGTGKLIDMIFGPSSEIIVLSRYYAFNIVLLVVLAALVIVLNNLLIPLHGIEGAAMATALTLGLFNLIKFGFIWWKMKMQPFRPATLAVLIIALATLGLNYLLPPLAVVWLDMMYRSAVLAVFFSALVVASGVSPEINRLFEKGLRLLRLRH